jgi:hypothetical protein
MAVAMALKLGVRLTRRAGASRGWSELGPPLLAGVLAGGGLVVSSGFISDNALGYSEGFMAALVLIAVDRHLDGKSRQAFAVAFLAALDRPEIWAFWGLYGLYLWWTDAGARKLVAALFALIPVFWFLPELAGSGHLFRGVSRAQHVRSNSAANASCPFCSELADHAWKLVLLRLKVVAAATLAVAAFMLWRARRSGQRPAGGRAYRPVLLAGSLGILWWLLIAVMTQAGFSGNNRYLVLGSALLVITGGVGWGWTAQAVGELLRRFTGARAAGAAGAATLGVVFMALPPWIGANVVDLPATHRALNYQAELRHDVTRAVRLAGGAQKLLKCGSVMTEGFQVPMVAWTLGVHTLRIGAPPAIRRGSPIVPAPAVVFQARATRRATLLPWLPPNASYKLLADARTFRIYSTGGKP